MNAHQQRKARRLIDGDHYRWPLGTPVTIRAGHHSPEAVGRPGKVVKHGYPCKDGVNCLVEFPSIVYDTTSGSARFCHYVDYRHLIRT